MRTPEQMIELASKIIAAKSHLASLEAEWNGLFRDGYAIQIVTNTTGEIETEVDGKTKIRGPREYSLTGRIVRLVGTEPHKDYEFNEILNLLGINDTELVRRAINKAVYRGLIERRGKTTFGNVRTRSSLAGLSSDTSAATCPRSKDRMVAAHS